MNKSSIGVDVIGDIFLVCIDVWICEFGDWCGEMFV